MQLCTACNCAHDGCCSSVPRTRIHSQHGRRPRRQGGEPERCPLSLVPLDCARNRAAEQGLHVKLARLLGFRRWTVRPPEDPLWMRGGGWAACVARAHGAAAGWPRLRVCARPGLTPLVATCPGRPLPGARPLHAPGRGGGGCARPLLRHHPGGCNELRLRGGPCSHAARGRGESATTDWPQCKTDRNTKVVSRAPPRAAARLPSLPLQLGVARVLLKAHELGVTHIACTTAARSKLLAHATRA